MGESEAGNRCKQSVATAMDAGDAFMVSQEDSVAARASCATADLVCSSWLARRNRILELRGLPREPTCPARARVRFGDGRFGEVRRAAKSPVGITGNKGAFTAFALERGSPASVRNGAMEALGGQ